jgi:acetoin utilization deacetylase AcuC-like enzyme
MTEVGAKGGMGYNVNIPWQRRGAGDADYEVKLLPNAQTIVV